MLQEAELVPGAIGFLGGGINVGFVFATFVRGPFTTALRRGQRPTFYAVKAHVAELGLVGVPGISSWPRGATVEVNSATKKWIGGTGALSPPAINWTTSLPGDGETDPAGLEIPTGGTNPSVYLDSDGFLIGGGANQFTLQISEFIYLAGSFYFEYGAVRTMPLTDGIVDTSLHAGRRDAVDLGASRTFIGGAEKELRFLTIGAQDVHAFVGLNGPYWVDADDGRRRHRPLHLGPNTGQIVAEEINHDAVGLVLDDVDFALALMTPTNRLDPIRYIALKASAAKVALVGSRPDRRRPRASRSSSTSRRRSSTACPATRGRLRAYDDDNGTDDPFAVKVGAPAEFGGDPIVVPFTFDTPLIRAVQRTVQHRRLRGAGPQRQPRLRTRPTVDVTLGDSAGTVVDNVVTTMTIGGANLLGFVGFEPNRLRLAAQHRRQRASGSTRTVTTALRASPPTARPCRTRTRSACDQRPRLRHLRRRQDAELHRRHRRRLRRDQHRHRQLRSDRCPRLHALGTLSILLNLGLVLGQTTLQAVSTSRPQVRPGRGAGSGRGCDRLQSGLHHGESDL